MAGEDPGYVAWVRSLPCVVGDWPACRGRVEAHHAGTDHGIGQRDHDRTAIPLCQQHHRDWHDHAGLFRDWTREERRDWAERQISIVLAARDA